MAKDTFDGCSNLDSEAEQIQTKSKSASCLWVRVANSTPLDLKIETFVTRARRQAIPELDVKSEIKLLKVQPSLQVRRGSVPVDYAEPKECGPDQHLHNLAGYTCDEIQAEADTDENSKLITLRISPKDEGQATGSWTITRKHKHGVIVIFDPSNSGKLLVIPAAGQFHLTSIWKTHPAFFWKPDIDHVRLPKLKPNYDPRVLQAEEEPAVLQAEEETAVLQVEEETAVLTTNTATVIAVNAAAVIAADENAASVRAAAVTATAENDAAVMAADKTSAALKAALKAAVTAADEYAAAVKAVAKAAANKNDAAVRAADNNAATVRAAAENPAAVNAPVAL